MNKSTQRVNERNEALAQKAKEKGWVSVSEFLTAVKNGWIELPPSAPCTWTMEDDDTGGVWQTDCGQELIIEESTPKGNQMKFCAFCGANLVEGLAPAKPQPCRTEQIPASPRYCTACHALLEDKSVYCDNCGTDTPR